MRLFFPRRLYLMHHKVHSSFIACLLVTFCTRLYAQPPPASATPKPISVVVANVEVQEAFGETLEALGTTRANESVDITANVTEFVREIRFEDGDHVREGDILVVLQKDEEEAALKSAQALLDERKAAFQRAQDLVQQQALSTATLEEREALLRQIEGSIEGIEAQLRDRVLRAPFDGILGLREISVGSLVRPGDLITTIDDISQIKVDFEVPAVFLSALRPGLTLQGKVRAYEGEVFTGSISSLGSRVDPVTRTIPIRAVLPNADGRLRPGLLMAIEVTKTPRRSLLIPEGALVQRGTQNKVFTIAEKDGQTVAVEKTVQTGTRIPGKVEILSGLDLGDQVVVHGLMQIRPGNPVTVQGVQTGDRPLTDFTGDTLRTSGGN